VGREEGAGGEGRGRRGVVGESKQL